MHIGLMSGESFTQYPLSKNTGKFERDRITLLFGSMAYLRMSSLSWNVKSGLKITTRRWHPFVVFDNGKDSGKAC